VGLVSIIVLSASTAGLALMTRSIVNDVFSDGDKSKAGFVAFAVFALSLLKGGSAFFQTVAMAEVKRKIVSKLRIQQFEKLIRSSTAQMGGKSPADFLARINHSAEAASAIILETAINAPRDILLLVSLFTVMVIQDPLMTAFALIGFPVIMLGLRSIFQRVKRLAGAEREFLAQSFSVGAEAMHGIRIVKAFGIEDKAIGAITNSIRNLERRSVKLDRASALASPLMEIVSGVIIAAFILYASHMILVVGAQPGEYVAFITAFLLAYEPAKKLAALNVRLQRNIVGVEKLYELLDTSDPEERDADLPDLTAGSGALSVRNLEFGYDPDKPVLQGISFEVNPGETLALVGRSGSGKTTFINLLLRLTDGFSGTVEIDGQDILSVNRRSLRRSIALIDQSTFLFDDTVANNIRLPFPTATDADVIRAAKAASADGFISELPEGYNTQIGDNGARLSGGQRQRIAIARALLSPAPLLIMDEPTSAMDGESERSFLADFPGLQKGRTTIVVAHRLSTIMAAERILLLDQGRIVATGTHEELSAASPLYRSLFMDQATG
ncbi:MAG TPA: ABC transporter ATP-binding protein, partial [Paracoccaceae bacterium]|nr:ABC transporter ATP-binding protein [Paracoccaceae bacterium]